MKPSPDVFDMASEDGMRKASAEGEGRGAGYHPDQTTIILAITAIIAMVLSVALKGFFSLGNFFALLRGVSVLGVFGLGMAVVVIGKGIDLSQIAIGAVCAALAIVMIGAGFPVLMSLVACLAVAACLGVFNGFLISIVEIPALFATLASGLLFLGIARSTYVKHYVVYLAAGHQGLLSLGGNIAGVVPVPVIIFIGCALVTHLFLSRTVLGHFIYGHGDNADAARLAGIAVRPLTMLEYAVSAMIGYVGAVMMVSASGMMHLQIAEGTLIYDVILVVVLGGVSLMGGRGSVMSVIAGALLIGVMKDAMTIANVDSQTQQIIMGAVLLLALVLDSYVHPRDEETAKQGEF
jgi:ribose transport system permease protein